MDVRCGSCNKLFRVADEKIAGKGIKFKCSRCSEIITITKEDFEHYQERQAAKEELAAKPAQPAPPVPPPAPQPPVVAAPPAPPAEPEQKPPAALVDFDFSAPHEAAGGEPDPFASADFSFEAPPTPEPAVQPGAGAAELTSEEPEPDLGAAFKIDLGPELGQEPEQEREQEAEPEREPAPPLTSEPFPPAEAKPADAFTLQVEEAESPPPVPSPEVSIPRQPVAETPKPAPPKPSAAKPAAPFQAVPESRGMAAQQNAVNPFASGNATGLAAGLGCAVPLALLFAFGASMLIKFIPQFAGMPLLSIVALMSASIISLGVLIGILIAVVQAGAGKKLFFLLNILLGAFFGAVLGAVQTAVSSLLSGTGLNPALLISSGIAGGAGAFLVSILIVLARRMMFFTREEHFSARLSGAQIAGLAVSATVMLVALFGEQLLLPRMITAGAEMTAAEEEVVSAEGLAAVNPYGYVDQKSGDLVVTGSVQNNTDREKTGWYLVVDVVDAAGKKVAFARMANGKQLYTGRDYEIMARRGTDVNELKVRMLAEAGAIIPAKGSVNFELRVIEPPAGIASFSVSLQPFNPLKLAEEMRREMGQQ